ncbi:lysozyme [Hermetia illucens]|nr:lysozyme [Hermetia illucens]
MASAKSDILLKSIVTISLLCAWSEAKVFTRCQLAKELIRYDFPRTFLSNWVCLIESESGRSTSKTLQLPNTSANYGIFQINSKTWCRKGRKGGLCEMKCEDFLNDDISDDARCAKQIYNRHGFQGWPGWVNKCRGRPLPDVLKC